MSFSDPVKIIDHIPQDFDMKIKQRHRGQIKPVFSALITGAWE